jgi:hypothetical protein
MIPEVPNQPGDDEDTGRTPVIAVVFGVLLCLIVVVALVVTR